MAADLMNASRSAPNPTDFDRLVSSFAFSQSSLQAYADCPRRFWLAYIRQLPWPAVEVSPVQEHEQLMRLGAAYHRLIERAEIGIDPDRLAAGLPDPLSRWFELYRRHRPADLPTEFVETERVLGVPLVTELPAPEGERTVRLAAQYDLIAAERGGRVVILDWKSGRRRPDPAALRGRLQSAVYPFVLVEASAGLPWGPVEPEQVEMRYWFTAAPAQPIVFRYDRALHDANRQRLQRLLADILAGQSEEDFPKVPDTPANRRRLCAYCVYRSRCSRGQRAGELDELDDLDQFFVVDFSSALEFTLDDVTELAF